MLRPEGLCVIQKSSEPLMVVAKDQPSQQRLARCGSEEGVVPILRNINPYD
jgi:hypothetical protein